ncbi:hypothetical protein ACTXT7_008548 [Hymenolepis weldensis]
MIGDYVRADPTEVPNVMHAHEVYTNTDVREGHIMTPPLFPQGPRVNAVADAYVKTLQIIVKLPWIDSVANGGRPPYVFQQDSAPSHKHPITPNPPLMEAIENINKDHLI